jgi:hypothetical protein
MLDVVTQCASVEVAQFLCTTDFLVRRGVPHPVGLGWANGRAFGLREGHAGAYPNSSARVMFAAVAHRGDGLGSPSYGGKVKLLKRQARAPQRRGRRGASLRSSGTLSRLAKSDLFFLLVRFVRFVRFVKFVVDLLSSFRAFKQCHDPFHGEAVQSKRGVGHHKAMLALARRLIVEVDREGTRSRP